MKDTKKIKISKRIMNVLLLAALIVASCRAKTTHLTQDLENPGATVQNTSQRPEEATQIPGEEIASVIDLTATSIEPLATQSAPVTSTPVQASASAPVVLTPTATKKPATTQAATSTSSPLVSPTKTSTPTRTLTPTATTALTPSPTLQTGWDGEWTAYVVQADGSVLVGILTVTLAGDIVNGEFDVQGSLMNLEGNFLGAGGQVSGSYVGFPGNGFFKWLIREGGTFVGNLDNQRAFCGARPGLPQPDPCGYFDPE